MKTRQRVSRTEPFSIGPALYPAPEPRHGRAGAGLAPLRGRSRRATSSPCGDPSGLPTGEVDLPGELDQRRRPLVCELAPMADAEDGEEPFPVPLWLLAPPEEDFE